MNTGDLIVYEHWLERGVVYLTGVIVKITPRQHRAVIDLERPPAYLDKRISVLTRNLFVRFERPKMGEPLK